MDFKKLSKDKTSDLISACAPKVIMEKINEKFIYFLKPCSINIDDIEQEYSSVKELVEKNAFEETLKK